MWGHSFGSIVGALYAARHPDHAGGLVLQSTRARFDIDRIADGFRPVGGDEIGELARRYYAGDASVVGEFTSRALPLTGPWVPGEREIARTVVNEDLLASGLELLHGLDLADDLGHVTCPTLICVGELDPSAQVADAHEVAAQLHKADVQLEIFEQAGHFAWKDVPERYWPVVRGFLADAATTHAAAR